MKIKNKGKEYLVKEIALKIHLGYWYLYDSNHFLNEHKEICFGFLCFNLIFTVEEIKIIGNLGNSIGFKK